MSPAAPTEARFCQWGECGAEFMPTHHRQVYCSPEHRTLANNWRNRVASGPIKRRGPRTVHARETHCLWCREPLTGKRRRFCCDRHAELWDDARRRELTGNRGETFHRISDLDTTRRMGTCSICGPDTPLQSAGKSGWVCKSLFQTEAHRRTQRRAGWLKREIDLTLDEYDKMLVIQGNRCAICDKSFADDRGSDHVDHSHRASKVVRGLLCGSCNNGLGRFFDRPELLRQAADYLDAFASFPDNTAAKTVREELLASLCTQRPQ